MTAISLALGVSATLLVWAAATMMIPLILFYFIIYILISLLALGAYMLTLRHISPFNIYKMLDDLNQILTKRAFLEFKFCLSNLLLFLFFFKFAKLLYDANVHCWQFSRLSWALFFIISYLHCISIQWNFFGWSKIYSVN